MNWQFFPASDFAHYRDAWDWLNRQGPDTPLLDARFVEPLLKHFGGGGKKLAVAGPPDQPAAMAIVTRVKPGVWSTFQPSQAPLGMWLAAAGSPAEELLPSLARSLSRWVMVFGVTQQDPHFCARPPDAGHIATLDYIQTAHINIDKPFEDYWSLRGKNLRHNLKRQRNRLEREGVQTRLEMFSEPAEMALAVRQYGEMESSGWKSKDGSAVHADNAQGRFYIDALSALAQTGQGRVYRYHYNDKLVATDLCVLGNKTIVILKTTYDETIEGSSPAMLMRQDMFEGLFAEENLERIEFYGQVMDWHTKWSEDFRFMYHVNYYPWTLLKLLKNRLSPEEVPNGGAQAPGAAA